MASAALDCLLHRSTVLKFNGDSYRMMENKKAEMKLTEEVNNAPKNWSSDKERLDDLSI